MIYNATLGTKVTKGTPKKATPSDDVTWLCSAVAVLCFEAF